MKKFCDLLWTIHTVLEYERNYQCQITRSYLIRLLEGSFLGGRKTKAQQVLELLSYLKLLGINDEHYVFIMPRGKLLAESNGENTYELNDKQKSLLTTWYVSSLDEVNKQWLGNFRINDSGKKQADRSQIPKSLQQWTEEMLYLGVAVQYSNQILLSGKHAWMSASQVEQIPMTLDELQAILEQQEQAGRKAEEYVVFFEKRRLEEQGLIAEANRIECISDSFVNAGYDVLSFSSPALEPNRFIEVKSVQKDHSFYWSRHELEVAKELGNLYYLYLVDQSDPTDPTVQIIENPYSFLSLHAHLEPIQYKVSFLG